MRWFSKFMIGRRGTDQLGLALLVLFLILSVVFIFLPSDIVFIRLIAYIPLAICIFRMLSKNIEKRQIENNKFTSWLCRIIPKINKRINIIKYSKNYKFIKCPKCKQLLRLPRRRGKIMITCPKCSNTFDKRT